MSLADLSSSEAEDLKWLETWLPNRGRHLRQALETVELEGVSNYPLLVFSRSAVELGLPLGYESGWYVQVSTLEEVYVKRLIGEVEAFRKVFRARKEAGLVCVLWLGLEQKRWLFLPWTEKN